MLGRPLLLLPLLVVALLLRGVRVPAGSSGHGSGEVRELFDGHGLGMFIRSAFDKENCREDDGGWP